jgi:hypothetical protein
MPPGSSEGSYGNMHRWKENDHMNVAYRIADCQGRARGDQRHPCLATLLRGCIVIPRKRGKILGTVTMVIFKGKNRFEITVHAHYGKWMATLREFVPGRPYPTQHLLRTFDTRHAAINALVRKWRVLFPHEAPLAWRESPPVRLRRQSQRSRHHTGKGQDG